MVSNILVTKDSKGKVRVVEINYDWYENIRGFIIKRKTYQYNGKVSIQPDICIFEGKAKRTVTEQVKLEYASHVKKYLDKGYKTLPNNININDEEQVNAFVLETMGEATTDSNGFKKHMLAKQADKIATSVFDKLKYWYGSRKIDGVRNSFYLKDNIIVSASRGGTDYDFSTQHLRNHPKLIALFEKMPNLVLDGELYIHGRSLQYISGVARLKQDAQRCSELQYYIYDIQDADKTFEERLEILDEIKELLNLDFDVNQDYKVDDLKIKMVPQEKVTGWANIQKLHDKYVEEGFEGLVIRDPSKVYRYGGRTNDMVKIKNYQEDEFLITGIKEGLREEDMCFTCETKEGKSFEAKPLGSREIKQEYRNNLSSIIGKMGTVKYFTFSDEGKPTQTNLKCIRDYE